MLSNYFFEAISRFPHSLFFEEKSKKELKQMLQSGLGIVTNLVNLEFTCLFIACLNFI